MRTGKLWNSFIIGNCYHSHDSDERRRPRRDAPAADLLTKLVNFRQTLKKLPDPPCLGEALRRVILLNFYENYNFPK